MLGDSLSAGLGLPAQEAFPAKLQKALQAKDIAVDMTNAGVSGDTSSGGRDRLDWSVPDGTDGVIVELGANDALRGIDPDLTRAASSPPPLQASLRPSVRPKSVLLTMSTSECLPRRLFAAWSPGVARPARYLTN